MNACKQIEPLMADALAGIIRDEDRRILEAHLNTCPSCSHKFKEFESVLAAMKTRENPGPDPEFMESFWTNLSPKLDKTSKRNLLKHVLEGLVQPRFTVPAMAAVCLILGIWIGRGLQSSPPQLLQNQTSGALQVQNAAAEKRALQMLDRSQTLLLAIVNFDPATEETDILNMDQQKIVAQQLVHEARDVKPLLSRQEDKRLKRLTTELEAILLQIANLETESNMDNVDLIRIGAESVLFKIQLTGIADTVEESPVTPSQQI